MAAYGSNTINNVNSVRSVLAVQDPIGATVDVPGVTRLMNGTIGGGFNAADVKANFPLGQLGRTDNNRGAVYAGSSVNIAAGTTTALLVGSGFTAATGGTYTIPFGVKAGEFVWAFLT